VKRFLNFILGFLESKGIFIARKPEIKYFNLFSNQVIDNFLSKSGGVLHIGAYEGEERDQYSRFGLRVLWIEALPDTHKVLTENILSYENQTSLNVILGDKDVDSVNFHVSSNGQSSSLLKFSKNMGFEGVVTTQVIQARMRSLDSLGMETNITDLDFWVIDVQGAELLVLKGATESLKFCHALLVEVSTTGFYQEGVLWEELNSFLENAGFVSIWEPNSISHLNVLFVRTKSSN
jgi:FkbM family methyltransferase